MSKYLRENRKVPSVPASSKSDPANRLIQSCQALTSRI